MTILDFPTGGRARVRVPAGAPPSAAAWARPRASHPAAALAPGLGAPPTGAWLDAYEQLAACCAEVVATPGLRVYDADWEELVDWIRSCLAVLDELKAPGAS